MSHHSHSDTAIKSDTTYLYESTSASELATGHHYPPRDERLLPLHSPRQGLQRPPLLIPTRTTATSGLTTARLARTDLTHS